MKPVSLPVNIQQVLWVRQNRGIFKRIAVELSKEKRITRQTVSYVFWGRATSQRVAEALKNVGAPGFAEPAAEDQQTKETAA